MPVQQRLFGRQTMRREIIYIWLGSVYLTDSHKPFILASVVHIYIGIFKDSSILRQVYSLLCFYKISVPKYSSRKLSVSATDFF